MPWQQLVADVALEVDRVDGRLMPRYRNVVLTVPRQSGKTTLLLSVLIHRCLAWGSAQSVTYAAQNGVAARAKFLDEHVPILERSPFASLVSVRRTSGHESIEWANGSRHSITAATEKAGHGLTLDLPVIDEAFAYPDARLEQAFVPAMQTRPDAQLWIVSTAGNAQSTYLRGKVDTGRALVESGDTSRTAYFEWSSADDADADDPDVWRSCMPALGYTVQLPEVQAARDLMTDDEFRRAFLNQWRDGLAPEGGFPADAWSASVDTFSTPVDPVVFAVDASPNAASAAIAVGARRADGLIHLEIVDHRPGVTWVAERLAALVGRWSPAAIAIDPTGPASALVPMLERVGVSLIMLTGAESTRACSQLYAAVVSGGVRHRDEAPLNAAVAGAVRRTSGDSWRWNRKDSSSDISPLCAATVAFHQAGVVKAAPIPSVVDLSQFLEVPA
jgi:hypothetical protein